MTDINEIVTALAAQVQSYTGVQCLPYGADQVTPPSIWIMPKTPFARYGIVMDGGIPANSLTDLSLHALIIISRAQDIALVQSQLDGYLGRNTSVPSVPDAISANPTLDGKVDYVVADQVEYYGPIEIAGQTYFSARIGLTVGD